MTQLIPGLYTALVTPFRNGNVDVEALRTLISLQVKGGVQGIVALGTTAETPTLSHEEKKLVLKTIVSEVKGKVRVICGTGSNSTSTTIETTKWAEDLGADGALVVTPYYNKPTQSGIVQHFEAVASGSKLPIMVYNVPGRTATNITVDTMCRLAEIDSVQSVKEASGDIKQISQVIARLKEQRPEFLVFSGDDWLTYPVIALGGCGVVSVASNCIPERMSEFVSMALRLENRETVQKEHHALLELFDLLFVETNPSPVKGALHMLGLCSQEVRLPLLELTELNARRLSEKMKELGCFKGIAPKASKGMQ